MKYPRSGALSKGTLSQFNSAHRRDHRSPRKIIERIIKNANSAGRPTGRRMAAALRAIDLTGLPDSDWEKLNSLAGSVGNCGQKVLINGRSVERCSERTLHCNQRRLCRPCATYWASRDAREYAARAVVYLDENPEFKVYFCTLTAGEANDLEAQVGLLKKTWKSLRRSRRAADLIEGGVHFVHYGRGIRKHWRAHLHAIIVVPKHGAFCAECLKEDWLAAKPGKGDPENQKITLLDCFESNNPGHEALAQALAGDVYRIANYCGTPHHLSPHDSISAFAALYEHQLRGTFGCLYRVPRPSIIAKLAQWADTDISSWGENPLFLRREVDNIIPTHGRRHQWRLERSRRRLADRERASEHSCSRPS